MIMIMMSTFIVHDSINSNNDVIMIRKILLYPVFQVPHQVGAQSIFDFAIRLDTMHICPNSPKEEGAFV